MAFTKWTARWRTTQAGSPLKVGILSEWVRMQKGMAWVSMGAESKNRECDHIGRRGGIVQRAVSGGSGDGDFLQGVAARGGAANVAE